MKQLVITSDDFGLSRGVNLAVEQAWREGILTCASIMPGGDAFEDAVQTAARNPGLQIGLHLTLVQGRPVLAPEEVPGLVDEEGNFSGNPVAAGMRYFFDRGLYGQLKREIEAQITRVRDAGIPLSHIDGHLNIHMHPTVFRILTDLMPRYGIRSFRLSQERLLQNLKLSRERLVGKAMESLIFGNLARNCREFLQSQDIRHAAEVKGVLNSGRMTEQYLLNIIEVLQDGLTEIYFHPGVLPDAEISRRMPDYRHQDELQALTSPAVRGRLQQLGVTLLNYRGEVKC